VSRLEVLPVEESGLLVPRRIGIILRRSSLSPTYSIVEQKMTSIVKGLLRDSSIKGRRLYRRASGPKASIRGYAQSRPWEKREAGHESLQGGGTGMVRVTGSMRCLRRIKGDMQNR